MNYFWELYLEFDLSISPGTLGGFQEQISGRFSELTQGRLQEEAPRRFPEETPKRFQLVTLDISFGRFTKRISVGFPQGTPGRFSEGTLEGFPEESPAPSRFDSQPVGWQIWLIFATLNASSKTNY